MLGLGARRLRRPHRYPLSRSSGLRRPGSTAGRGQRKWSLEGRGGARRGGGGDQAGRGRSLAGGDVGTGLGSEAHDAQGVGRGDRRYGSREGVPLFAPRDSRRHAVVGLCWDTTQMGGCAVGTWAVCGGRGRAGGELVLLQPVGRQVDQWEGGVPGRGHCRPKRSWAWGRGPEGGCGQGAACWEEGDRRAQPGVSGAQHRGSGPLSCRGRCHRSP